MTRVPEIIAHRGAPREALENTLRAFQIALDQGADGIELDVHATKDGVVVVHHDAALAVARNGEPSLVPIADLHSTEACQVPLRGSERLPTLDEVLDLVGPRACVYIEVKANGIARHLVECLDRHPASRVAVHAFDHRIPVDVRDARPSMSIGVLSTSYPVSLVGFIGAARPDALWQQAQLIDQALVDDAHALGARVIAWTENDAVHARSLIAMGVDALCTDTPGLLRAALTS
ncbi:MAG: glycerophosphodiester phosphodiesterase [Gemmatimonas sp.]